MQSGPRGVAPANTNAAGVLQRGTASATCVTSLDAHPSAVTARLPPPLVTRRTRLRRRSAESTLCRQSWQARAGRRCGRSAPRRRGAGAQVQCHSGRTEAGRCRHTVDWRGVVCPDPGRQAGRPTFGYPPHRDAGRQAGMWAGLCRDAGRRAGPRLGLCCIFRIIHSHVCNPPPLYLLPNLGGA
eukprot:351613-Chlamydomonas_euryale.AAC.1